MEVRVIDKENGEEVFKGTASELETNEELADDIVKLILGNLFK